MVLWMEWFSLNGLSRTCMGHSLCLMLYWVQLWTRGMVNGFSSKLFVHGTYYPLVLPYAQSKALTSSRLFNVYLSHIPLPVFLMSGHRLSLPIFLQCIFCSVCISQILYHWRKAPLAYVFLLIESCLHEDNNWIGNQIHYFNFCEELELNFNCSWHELSSTLWNFTGFDFDYSGWDLFLGWCKS